MIIFLYSLNFNHYFIFLSFNFLFIELGTPGITKHVEKFTKYNNEKRMKQVEVIDEGVCPKFGFTFLCYSLAYVNALVL